MKAIEIVGKTVKVRCPKCKFIVMEIVPKTEEWVKEYCDFDVKTREYSPTAPWYKSCGQC